MTLCTGKRLGSIRSDKSGADDIGFGQIWRSVGICSMIIWPLQNWSREWEEFHRQAEIHLVLFLWRHAKVSQSN